MPTTTDPDDLMYLAARRVLAEEHAAIALVRHAGLDPAEARGCAVRLFDMAEAAGGVEFAARLCLAEPDDPERFWPEALAAVGGSPLAALTPIVVEAPCNSAHNSPPAGAGDKE